MSQSTKFYKVGNKPFIYSVFLCVLSAVVILTGCGKPPLPAIYYKQPINLHFNKNAILIYEPFKPRKIAPTAAQNNDNNKDLIEVILTTAKTSINQCKPNGRFFVSYDEEDQLNFINSLKDVLCQNDVFKNVTLARGSATLSPNDVQINLFFKKTRICFAERNYGIALTVIMTITNAGKPPFTRRYFVQSDPDASGLVSQKRDVSTRLMEKLIMGIKEWGS